MKVFLLALAWQLSASCAQHASPIHSSTIATKARESATKTPHLVRHDVDSDGHKLTIWEKSPESPVGVMVLVHGRTWSSLPDFDLQVPGESRSLMDSLNAEGYATFAVDLRGYGGTPRDETGWLTPNTAASDLATVLEWVRSRTGTTPALLGWSYGSLVSQLCAQRHADLVSTLILYGYPRGVDSTYPTGPAEGVLPKREATTAAGAAEDFIAEGAASPTMVKAFVKEAVASNPIRVDWRDRDQFASLNPGKVTVPTLLIHGEHDPYAPVKTQAAFFARLANGDRRWIILAGGDHAAHLESMHDQFVKAVVGFLGRPERR